MVSIAMPLFKYNVVSVQYYKLLFANCIEGGSIKTGASFQYCLFTVQINIGMQGVHKLFLDS